MTTNLAMRIHAEDLKPLHSALLRQAQVEAQDERARRQEERAYVDAFGSPWTPIDPKETIRDRLWNRIGAYLPPAAAVHHGNIYHKPGRDPLGKKGEEAIAKEGGGGSG